MATLVNSGFDPAELVARLSVVPRGISADSRLVRPGEVFAAYRGQAADGRAFIPDAIARGADAVLWDAFGFRWNPAWEIANLAVEDLKTKLGAIASLIYGNPSRSLWIAGVTGTNGKTSCSHWIAQCLEACGRRAGIIGTLGNGLAGALQSSTHTTPDAALVQATLAQMRNAGARAVAMEVSSHALDQGRVNGVEFDVALFTNLTRDHLDYHGTMAAYGTAKSRLFAWPGLDTRVVNVDDPFGQSLAEAARGRRQKVLTYGFVNADIVAAEIGNTQAGIHMLVDTPWGSGEVSAKVAGTFNAANMLGVLGVLLAGGIALDDALAALGRITAPPGRMQRFGGGFVPLVVVDYAHSPDALEKVLTALRPTVVDSGELICVFGCGGDRDAGKRPDMGRIAALLADRVIVTSDNPRGEDPAAIADAVVRGIRDTGRSRWAVELDRGAAIREAIASAHGGDVVLVAGKGHEDYQETNGVRKPFSDAEAATAALAEWGRANT